MTQHKKITKACETLRELAKNSSGDKPFNIWTKLIEKLCDVIIIASPTCPPSCGQD